MMAELTSRERLLRALSRQETDHVPCCFMSFTALRKRVREDMFALAQAERAMGLDAMLFIPVAPRSRRPEHPDLRGLPVSFPADVRTRTWHGRADDGAATLHREIWTPAGILTTAVRLSDDWPHGDRVPFVDDYQVPRCIKPLIAERRDLEALRYLLAPPEEEARRRFAAEAQRAHAFVREHQVLLAGGWGVGLDMADWLCGMEPLMVMTMELPALVEELLEIIHRWNLRRMEVVLAAPVDLYIRRAWYEGCDFVTPRFYRQAILPRLRAEVDLAHAHGARFGYICSSGLTPMLDLYREAGLDALIGIDPVQGTHTSLLALKQRLGDSACLWGGVSGAVTVEQGGEDEIREAVRQAIALLGPQGFVLSPVDNITLDLPQVWRNIDVFIDAWHRWR